MYVQAVKNEPVHVCLHGHTSFLITLFQRSGIDFEMIQDFKEIQ